LSEGMKREGWKEVSADEEQFGRLTVSTVLQTGLQGIVWEEVT
jgi:hypothetical protein